MRTHSRQAIGPLMAFVVAGCSGPQSVLHPAGPEALGLAHLTWFLFGFGALVLAFVLAAAAIAVRGPERWRAVVASRCMIIGAGVFFPAVSLTGLLGYGLWLTRASIPDTEGREPLQIEVTGEQWWWRVQYAPSTRSPVASANEIRVPAGRPIRFTLQSADVIHSFWVPNLAGKLDMIPGRATSLLVRAERTGVFRGQCAEYCGKAHALMALTVVVMTPTDFASWLENESRPAMEPDKPESRRGRSLFLEAGCGGCHTVRGTPAAGTIGPDLTHLGSRHSVGIASAAMNERNIARFMTDGQHMKPGNHMPTFRIFAAVELQAIATYLAGLR